MATARFETATQILKDAAVSLGLAEVSDPVASTEASQVRLTRLLTAAGRELVQLYRWPHLRKVCDITAALGDGRAWTLPEDYAGIVPDTAWNQTTDEWIRGSLTPEEWNRYEADGDTPSTPAYRIVQGVFAVIPADGVTDGDLLQYEYHSKSWVYPSGGSLNADRVTAGTDTVYFDPLLIGVALRRAWMLSTGMDTTAIEGEFWRTMERVKGAEAASDTLSLTRPRLVGPQPPYTRARNWTV